MYMARGAKNSAASSGRSFLNEFAGTDHSDPMSCQHPEVAPVVGHDRLAPGKPCDLGDVGVVNATAHDLVVRRRPEESHVLAFWKLMHLEPRQDLFFQEPHRIL
jgi:hypothetical protein